MRDHQRKCVFKIVDVFATFDEEIQRGRLGALNVGLGFFAVPEGQIGPHRGTGNEYLSPTAAYVGAVDQELVGVVFAVTVVREE